MPEHQSFSSTREKFFGNRLKSGLGVGLLLATLIFILDVLTPRGLVLAILYIPIVWIVGRRSSPRTVYIVAAVGSGFALLGQVVAPSSSGVWDDFFNRLFVILTIWMMAFVVVWRGTDSRKMAGWGYSKGTYQYSMDREGGQANSYTSQSKEQTLTALNQNLMDKNQELEMLVNVVSHDLRSPLVNIQGFSKELSSACERLEAKLEEGMGESAHKGEVGEIVGQEIPESLQYIKAAAGKMDAVLSGILRFTRLGRMTLKVEPLDVNAMVSVIAAAMEFQMKEKGVGLQIHDLPECVGDETLVSQVFFNLLENAHKYLDPSRPGIITVSGHVADEKVVFAVKDNGIGILPEHQGKIFEMFHRLNPKWESGEGLGLTIVKRIVERHQGEMWLESQPGAGTTFFVSFSKSVDEQKEEKH